MSCNTLTLLIQCLRTFRTLIVAAVDITDSLRLYLSLHEPFLLLPLRFGILSGGLLEADVATANAVAAAEVLLLEKVRGLLLEEVFSKEQRVLSLPSVTLP